jgi:hypothetical protein
MFLFSLPDRCIGRERMVDFVDVRKKPEENCVAYGPGLAFHEIATLKPWY